jgi:hypothetical protein
VGKVIPPDAVLHGWAASLVEGHVRDLARDAFARLLHEDTLVDEVVQQWQAQREVGLPDLRGLVTTALTAEPVRSWEAVLRTAVGVRVDPYGQEIEAAMRAALRDAIESLEL